MTADGRPPVHPIDIGRVGVWSRTDAFSATEAIDFARHIEALGYGALWIPDAFGRDPLTHAATLLAHTETLVVATGVVNIHLREPQATAGAWRDLHGVSSGRFLLGLGVSHGTMMERLHNKPYPPPLASMRTYLERMRAAMWWGPELDTEPPVVLAALGPKMLELSAEISLGAHPFFAGPENTARSRRILGPDAWLCPEQKLILETDSEKARARARMAMAGPLQMPNYRNNLLRNGFELADLDNGGSDRLVDSVIGWGDESALVRRVEAHWDAGATHVCVQPLSVEDGQRPDIAALEALARRLVSKSDLGT